MIQQIARKISIFLRKKIWLLSLFLGGGALIGGGVSASVLDIIDLHFQLAESSFVYQNITQNQLQKKFKNSDLWFVLSESEEFINTDLTQLLNTSDRENVLANYILDWLNLEQILGYHYNQQSSQLNAEKTQLATCQADLNIANANYRSALENNQEALYDQALRQVKQARTCIWEYGVSTSSLATLNNKIVRYRNAIQRRTQYLQANQSLIIKNYDMLNLQKLRELQKITSVLESTKK